MRSTNEALGTGGAGKQGGFNMFAFLSISFWKCILGWHDWKSMARQEDSFWCIHCQRFRK
jgi:hypothetical protein